MILLRLVITGFLYVSFTASAMAEGTLSDNILIESKALSYNLQYRVYTPDPKYTRGNMASLYVTDGQSYISDGKLPEVLDRLIEAKIIMPIVVIFVDSRSPDNLSINRRNEQFFCNGKYAKFFTKELIPTISDTYDISDERDDRVILGLSFGGTNSACFGVMIPQFFGGVAMQSPANSEHLKLLSNLYRERDKASLKIFMSFGKKKDNIKAGRRFKNILLKKGYDLTYVEVNQTHNWKNWAPLLDDLLKTFFSK